MSRSWSPAPTGPPVRLQLHRAVRSWQWGKVLGLYLIWYGLGRTWFESIRVDPSRDLPRHPRTTSGAPSRAIVLGIIIIAVQTRRHPGIEPSVYRPGKRVDPAL